MIKTGKRIYLDYAATTPIDQKVREAMREFELKYFGNPSSMHREGQKARALIDTARTRIGEFLHCKSQEIIFTSGATEANNLAIQGVIFDAIYRQKIAKPHVVTTLLEHQSVYNVVKEFESRGVIEATYVRPTKDGMIQADQIIKAVKKNTVLVSVIFVSNEIGSVLPIREIGSLLSTFNSQHSTQIIFHTDAVQALQFYNLNVEKLGCDLLTLSAHKIYGPKGIGALFVKKGTNIENLTFGGSQEYGLRPGTQNSTGIIGFAKAVELLDSLEERQKNADNISNLRDKFIYSIKNIPKVEINGPMGDLRVANNISLTIYDIDQDALMTAMDLAGIAVSTGSACVSGSIDPSYVIKALDKIKKRHAATIRFTLGNKTSIDEIDRSVEIFRETASKLQK